MSKKRVFSGIKPSGSLTLGNYLGAIKNFIPYQDTHDAIYCVVDLHAVTVAQDPAALHRQTLEIVNLYMASGLDPQKCTIFVQSQVPAHSELAWLLNCNAMMGELGRMTQYKEKSEGKESVSVGIFTYPVLMAADILLYNTHEVPVGDDQKQHVELTRDIAARFNHRFGETFVLPDPIIPKVGARIMSLEVPTKKMSKSESENSYILMLDDPKKIEKKILRATTDSLGVINFDEENQPGVANLLEILSLCSGEAIESIVNRLAGQGYGSLKKETAAAVVATLAPIQQRYRELEASGYAREVLKQGAQRAAELAQPVLESVRTKMGFLGL